MSSGLAWRSGILGCAIPPDLACQWIQGTGPATKPRSDLAGGLRNVAHALRSGADGWMFDGEDALGQVDTMSLEVVPETSCLRLLTA
jgi:malate synthase